MILVQPALACLLQSDGDEVFLANDLGVPQPPLD
jgi:hypothetical protein